ncbi:Hypothetical protein LUCI_1657 [Lucifera butyrica]|uniref:Uncharacterized protein n=2 Tax=Lucifera butyrica TaxID=1351585 RepID=A0A498R5P0_9FIRM|nr:Hypothetical protein LUCI_1657 [Lucifera butyrica]
MSPDEITGELKKLGVVISNRTLFNYERWGLIPRAERGAQRGGKWTDYPRHTIVEAYVAWAFLHGQYGDEGLRKVMGGKIPKLSPKAVSSIRAHAITLFTAINEICSGDKTDSNRYANDSDFVNNFMGDNNLKKADEMSQDTEGFIMFAVNIWNREIAEVRKKVMSPV